MALLAFAAIALIITHDGGTVGGLQNDQFARLVALLAIVIFIGGALLGSYRGRLGRALRDLTAWLVLALVLVGLYAYRADLMLVAERITGELMPRGSQTSLYARPGEPASVRVRRGWDGHFSARVDVNGSAIDMIVDTGASALVLRAEDAERIGIDLDTLDFNVVVQTANGRAMAARLRIDQVSLGPVVRRNVDALVTPRGSLTQSLLGMSFLSRLRSYEFSGDVLTLRG